VTHSELFELMRIIQSLQICIICKRRVRMFIFKGRSATGESEALVFIGGVVAKPKIYLSDQTVAQERFMYSATSSTCAFRRCYFSRECNQNCMQMMERARRRTCKMLSSTLRIRWLALKAVKLCLSNTHIISLSLFIQVRHMAVYQLIGHNQYLTSLPPMNVHNLFYSCIRSKS